MTMASLHAVTATIDDEGRQWKEDGEKARLYRRMKRYLDKHGCLEGLPEDELVAMHEAGVLYATSPPTSKYGHKPMLNLVVDDAQGTPLLQAGGSNPFLNACIRHRHLGDGLGCSFYLLMQSYLAPGCGLPRMVRENCTHLLVFRVKDPKMLEKIADEASGSAGPSEFMSAYERAVTAPDAPPHSFLLVDFCPKRADRTYRRNWDTYVGAEPRRSR
jgi:hypothetical protein